MARSEHPRTPAGIASSLQEESDDKRHPLAKLATGELEISDLRRMAASVLSSPVFDGFIALVIVLNAVTIGVGLEYQLDGQDISGFTMVESIFLVIYVVELFLRMFVLGRACLWDNWIRLDWFLVILGVCTSWIIEPFFADSVNNLGVLTTLRMARLLRLAKTARLLATVKEFGALSNGFLNSIPLLIYAFLSLFLGLYVFACIGCELIAKHSLNETDEEFEMHASRYFGTLPRALWTLVRFTCLEGMAEVYQPLVEKEPWLSLYFLSLIILVSIVMFHLLGAVILSTMMISLEDSKLAQDSQRFSHQESWSATVAELKALVRRMDRENTGRLSKDQILGMDQSYLKKFVDILGCKTPMEMFVTLDSDRDGYVSVHELLDGIWDAVSEKQQEGMRPVEKQVQNMNWRLKESFCLIHDVKAQLRQVVEDLKVLKAGQLQTMSRRELRASTGGKLLVSNGHGCQGSSQGFGQGSSQGFAQGSGLGSSQGSSLGSSLGDEENAPWAGELMDRLRTNFEASMQESMDEMLNASNHSNGREVASHSRKEPGRSDGSSTMNGHNGNKSPPARQNGLRTSASSRPASVPSRGRPRTSESRSAIDHRSSSPSNSETEADPGYRSRGNSELEGMSEIMMAGTFPGGSKSSPQKQSSSPSARAKAPGESKAAVFV